MAMAMAAAIDQALYQLAPGGGHVLNPHATGIVGVGINPAPLVGHTMDLLGFGAVAGVRPAIVPFPFLHGDPLNLNFCWCCSIVLNHVDRVNDPVATAWASLDPLPSMRHSFCNHSQLQLNGNEQGVYVNRTSTAAFAALRLNVLGGIYNYAEANQGQQIEILINQFNLMNLQETPMCLVNSGEGAYEADQESTLKFSLQYNYIFNKDPFAPPRLALVQHKRFNTKYQDGGIYHAQLVVGHAYRESTLIIINIEVPNAVLLGFPVGPIIWCYMNGNNLSVGTTVLNIAQLTNLANGLTVTHPGTGMMFIPRLRSQVAIEVREHYKRCHYAYYEDRRLGNADRGQLVNSYFASEVRRTGGGNFALRTAWSAKMSEDVLVNLPLIENEGMSMAQGDVEFGPDARWGFPFGDSTKVPGNALLANLENGAQPNRHVNFNYINANGVGPRNTSDERSWVIVEEKTETDEMDNIDIHPQDSACGYSIGHPPITPAGPYDGRYADFFVIIPKPVINAAGFVQPRSRRTRNCMWISSASMINSNFMHSFVGRICNHCGLVNPGHTSNVPGSGNFIVQATRFVRSQVDPAAMPGLTHDARDPLTFVGGFGGGTVTYRMVVSIMTREPVSRWAMEYFIDIPGAAGHVLTPGEVRAIFEDLVVGYGL